MDRLTSTCTSMKNLSRLLTDLRVQLSLYPDFAALFATTSVTLSTLDPANRSIASVHLDPANGSIASAQGGKQVTGSQVFSHVLERLLAVTVSKKPILEALFEQEGFEPCYPHLFYALSSSADASLSGRSTSLFSRSSSHTTSSRYADSVPENEIRFEVCKAVQVCLSPPPSFCIT